jgi:hypothetical protein
VSAEGIGVADEGVACALTPAEQRARRDELSRGLVREIRAHRELPDGYELEFASAPDVIERLAAFIAFESACCGFLDFQLRVPSGGRAVTLRLTGSPEAKRFLRESGLGAESAPAPSPR